MKILNFGSLNYDYVYAVDHILLPGETSAAYRMDTFCGGKGLNQSVALARAGAQVWHAGLVGEEDGGALLDLCAQNGVKTQYIGKVPGKSGHTVIQVDKKGQNNILLFGGANQSLTADNMERVLSAFGSGDMLLLQNEVNGVPKLIEKGYERGMRIVLNPSPYNEIIGQCDLSKVSILLVNEIEGWQISGLRDPEEILNYFSEKYPQTAVVLTLGSDGVQYRHGQERYSHGIYPVKVVDTTAAGDTFTGFFLAGITGGKTVEEALKLASKASSIAVSRKGAAPSIPTLDEVRQFNFS